MVSVSVLWSIDENCLCIIIKFSPYQFFSSKFLFHNINLASIGLDVISPLSIQGSTVSSVGRVPDS